MKYTSIKDLTEITGLNKQTKKQKRRRNTRTQTHTHSHTQEQKTPKTNKQNETKKWVSKPNCVLEILMLHALSVFLVTSSEVRAGLLFNALKRQKLAKFPRTELKPFETVIYSLNRTFSLRVIGKV